MHVDIDVGTPPISPFTERLIAKRSRQSFDAVLAWSDSVGLQGKEDRPKFEIENGQDADVPDMPAIRVSPPNRVSPNGWMAGVETRARSEEEKSAGSQQSPTNSSIPSLDTLELVLDDPQRFANEEVGEVDGGDERARTTGDDKRESARCHLGWGDSKEAHASTEFTRKGGSRSQVDYDRFMGDKGLSCKHAEQKTDGGGIGVSEKLGRRTPADVVVSWSGRRLDRGELRRKLPEVVGRSTVTQVLSPRSRQSTMKGTIPRTEIDRRERDNIDMFASDSSPRSCREIEGESREQAMTKLPKSDESERVEALVKTINQPLDEMDKLERAAADLRSEIRSRLEPRRNIKHQSDTNHIVDFADWASASVSMHGKESIRALQGSEALVNQLIELEEGFEEIGKDNQILSTALKVVSERLDQADKLKAQLIQQNTQLCASLQEANNSNEQLLKQHALVTKELAELKLQVEATRISEEDSSNGERQSVRKLILLAKRNKDEPEVNQHLGKLNLKSWIAEGRKNGRLDKNTTLRALNQSTSEEVEAAKYNLDRERRQLQDVKARLQEEHKKLLVRVGLLGEPSDATELSTSDQSIVEEHKEEHPATRELIQADLNKVERIPGLSLPTKQVSNYVMQEEKAPSQQELGEKESACEPRKEAESESRKKEVDEELIWIQKAFGEYHEVS